MKIKKFVLVLTALMLSIGVMAQEKQLSAMFGYSTFYLPNENQPYVETYLSFDAWTLNFKASDNGKYKATVEVVMVIKEGDSIVFAKKYDLNSPAISSIDDDKFVFMDLQRIGLKNGIYNLELSIKDKAVEGAPYMVTERLVVFYEKKKPALSSLQLMASAKKSESENTFTRNGYDMEPYISDFIPEQINQLNVYYEVYNIQKEIFSKPFVSYVFIEEKETGRKVGNIMNISRHESRPTVGIYSSVDISQLPSGNYNLVVEIHDKDNENLLYKRVAFYRSNPNVTTPDHTSLYAGSFAALITDENKLNYYLDALYPIASDIELSAIRTMIKSNGNIEEKQAFLYNFWTSRYEMNAEDKWREYKGWLEVVDKQFAYPRTPGYRTERGRVYLQYGPPDYIRDEKNFVSTKHMGSGTNMQKNFGDITTTSQGHIYYLPYQLWRYNKLDKDDPNRVFLFWDEFRSGYYKLLNSNARGEVREEMWERRLCQQQLNEGEIGEVGEQFERGY